MPRTDAPGASAQLRRLEQLLRRQQKAIRERRPTELLEVTEALEAEVAGWAAQRHAVPSDEGAVPPDGLGSGRDLSPAERRLVQRVRALQEANQALLEQEAHWVQFMLEHLRPGFPTYSGDGRLKQGTGQVIIDRHA